MEEPLSLNECMEAREDPVACDITDEALLGVLSDDELSLARERLMREVRRMERSRTRSLAPEIF